MAKKSLIFLILIILIIAGALTFRTLRENKEEAVFFEGDEYVPPLVEEIKEGEYKFWISSTSGIYPKFTAGSFSERPKDFLFGQDKQLKGFIKIEDPEGVEKVKLVIVGKDNENKEIKRETNLKLIEGSEKEGIWQGEIEIPKEIKEFLWTNFLAENKRKKEEKLEIAWSEADACQAAKGDVSYNASCDISSSSIKRGAAGSEKGIVTIKKGGTVSLHGGNPDYPAYLIFGDSIRLEGGNILLEDYTKTPTIIVKAGRLASIPKILAHICVKDADSDDYRDKNDAIGRYPGTNDAGDDACYTETTGTSYRLVSNASGLGDCNDDDGNKWRLAGIYPDEDGDMYGEHGVDATIECLGNSAGSEKSFNDYDCDDASAVIKPRWSGFQEKICPLGTEQATCKSGTWQGYSVSCPGECYLDIGCVPPTNECAKVGMGGCYKEGYGCWCCPSDCNCGLKGGECEGTGWICQKPSPYSFFNSYFNSYIAMAAVINPECGKCMGSAPDCKVYGHQFRSVTCSDIGNYIYGIWGNCEAYVPRAAD